MLLVIHQTCQFKKDVKAMRKQRKDLNPLDRVVAALQRQDKLDARYKDHALKGGLDGYWECHIQADCFLVYIIDKGRLILTLTRTGTHAELLGR